jgi:type IV fimbrial biogenesis protein FimT
MSTKQQGLTLIELMVTLAVAIILVAVGMPLFSGIAANNRAVAQTNALITALNLGRSEAVRRGTPVAVCTSASPLPVASPACATSGPVWTNGWFVFADDDNDGVVDGGEDVLRIWEALSNNATVAATGTNAWISFDTAGAADGLHTFQLAQSDATGNQIRCVTVTGAGNIRMKRGTCP